MIKIHDFAKDRTMNAQICFSRCSGTLPAVSSKSVMHRLLLAAALGDTPVCIRYYGDSDDISATMGCVSALGGRIEEEKTPGKDTVCKVFPVSEGKRSVPCNLDCRGIRLDPSLSPAHCRSPRRRLHLSRQGKAPRATLVPPL